MNAKDMLAILRENLNEASAGFWTDLALLRRLNIAQNKVGLKVAQTPGQWLITSTSVTPSNSVITLPTDCAKPIYLEETSSGAPIHWLNSVTYRRRSREVGTTLDLGSREAYPLMSTLEVNTPNYSTACTLWYQIRIPKLHCGTAQSGSGASALEFDDAAESSGGTGREIVFLDDYYNNAIVEIIDQTSAIVDIRSTISDFTASTHVAVITGTPASGDTYGTVSRLPEQVLNLIILEATMDALNKPSAQIDKEARQYFVQSLRDERSTVNSWLESRIPEPGYTVIGDEY